MSEHVSAEQLSLLIDGELSLASREAVVTHIRSCPRCAAEHDRLIELTATLRLRPSLEWAPAQTAATMKRLGERARSSPRGGSRRRRGRDWSLPLAAVLAFAGVFALIELSLGTVHTAFSGATVLFAGGSLLSSRLLIALVVALAIGLLAFPLSRSR